MKKNILIAALGALVLWESRTIIRIENQRYAMAVGLCRNTADPTLPSDTNCLASVQTRTSWAWHLYYGLTN